MPSTPLPTTADVVVIGGGIIGLCTAIYLARKHLSVVLLEQNFVGSGPTGRSLAVISQHYSQANMVALARIGLDVFRHFERHFGAGCGWTETGLLALVDEKSAPQLRTNVEMQRQQGVQVELLDRHRLASLDARLHIDDIAIGSYQPTAGYADPQQTVHTLYQAALAGGVQLYEHHPAINILTNGDRISGVVTPQGTIATPIAIDTAGPWARQVAHFVDIDIPIVSCRQTMATLHRPIAFGEPHPIVNDFILGTSFRSDGNTTYIGRFDRSQTQDPVAPDEADGSVSGAATQHVATLWKRRYPSGKRAITTGGWSGLYDVTPDWMPICDRFGPDGFYACCGTSGHGFKFGPVFGQGLANWVVDGSTGAIDLSPLSVQRFVDRRQFDGAIGAK